MGLICHQWVEERKTPFGGSEWRKYLKGQDGMYNDPVKNCTTARSLPCLTFIDLVGERSFSVLIDECLDGGLVIHVVHGLLGLVP